MTGLRLHRRQYVIGPAEYLVDENWVSVELGSGLWLSRCRSLPLEETPHGLRLGLAFPSRDGAGPEGWSGRFVLLDAEQLMLDAVGTLTCFYREIDGAVWVSSSPELLRRLSPVLDLPSEALRWDGKHGEWLPPAFSGIRGMARLVPSQRLDVRRAKLEPRRLLPALPALDYGATIDEIERRLRRTVREIAAGYRLWLPLTGGNDSRLLLATCVAEGVDVVTFTFERGDKLNECDRRLPPAVAAAAGREHRLIPRGPYDPTAVELYDEHAALHSDDLDRECIAYGQWQQIPGDVLVVGGNVFGTGRSYYYWHPPEPPTKWFDWAQHNPDNLDWRDRFNIEHLMAGWLGTFEQGFDVVGRTRVHVANCGELLALLLSLPEEVRMDGFHHSELIRRTAPALARFRANAVYGLRARARTRVARERNLLRYRGSATRYLGHRIDRIVMRLRQQL